MCKRHHRHGRDYTRYQANSEAYEGDIIQLNRHAAVMNEQRRHWCGTFPWWTLWLIWPLIIGFKALVAVLPNTLAKVTSGWEALALPVQVLVAVALIVLGVAVLQRSNRE